LPSKENSDFYHISSYLGFYVFHFRLDIHMTGFREIKFPIVHSKKCLRFYLISFFDENLALINPRGREKYKNPIETHTKKRELRNLEDEGK
jgi:hypothetical protein